MGGIAKLLLVLTSLAPSIAVYGFATWLLGVPLVNSAFGRCSYQIIDDGKRRRWRLDPVKQFGHDSLY